MDQLQVALSSTFRPSLQYTRFVGGEWKQPRIKMLTVQCYACRTLVADFLDCDS